MRPYTTHIYLRTHTHIYVQLYDVPGLPWLHRDGYLWVRNPLVECGIYTGCSVDYVITPQPMNEWSCTTLPVKEHRGKACTPDGSQCLRMETNCWLVLIADVVILKYGRGSEGWTNVISTSCCWLSFWYSGAESNLTAEEDWHPVGIHRPRSPNSYPLMWCSWEMHVCWWCFKETLQSGIVEVIMTGGGNS